jgi:hypothetical protein
VAALDKLEIPEAWQFADRLDLARILPKVEFQANGCWIFTGCPTQRNAQVTLGKTRKVVVYRAAMEWVLGFPVPDAVKVCHHCDNSRCLNPKHLFLGTQGDNVRDMHAKGRANTPRGTSQSVSKLDDSKVREIRALFASGIGRADIARNFGVSWTTVDFVLRGRTWKHVA